MTGYDEDFAGQCGEYLDYLYGLAGKYYGDCPDIDSLVQDTLTVLIVKIRSGGKVEHPKGFLSAVMRNKYNEWLRERYKTQIVEYTDGTAVPLGGIGHDRGDEERRSQEYEAVRREIGRLIGIYRDVTVRHYVHGRSVERISEELGIPRGTVLSRLSAARARIKEGLEKMEKYSQISYEPKTASIGIWGYGGLDGEPFSLMHSDIETNILVLAYENPISVRGIADTMGMPAAYIEPIIDRLVDGELMGRTSGGLVYTRCFVQNYEDSFGDIPAQEKLAEEYASRVWQIVAARTEPLTKHGSFAAMSEKQKATFLLFLMNQMLNDVLRGARPASDGMPKEPPERPDGGKWLATLTVSEHGQKRDNKYDGSGPVCVNYAPDGAAVCRMYDLQSVFGDAHWAYGSFRYKFNLQTILRFYASFLPCGVTADDERLYGLIPDFEKLCILKRGDDGEIGLDIPAMPFSEMSQVWEPVCNEIKRELSALLSDELRRLWTQTKNRVPKHVDEAEYFVHSGALSAYTGAQLLAIVNQGLMPYPVTVGKTPVIFIAYREREE